MTMRMLLMTIMMNVMSREGDSVYALHLIWIEYVQAILIVI